MIELRNIEKSYEARSMKTFVLRRITLNIKEGEFRHDHGTFRGYISCVNSALEMTPWKSPIGRMVRKNLSTSFRTAL